MVLDSDILTKEEVFSIIKRLCSVSSSPVGFPETKRNGFQFEGDIQQCLRFISWLNSYSYSYSGTDAINVSVDKDVVLHGVCLFGRENTTYTVELDVMDPRTESICASKTGQFCSELLQRKNYNYYGYRVSFDKKIILKQNKKYDIRAKISGPPSPRGARGHSSVLCSEVAFTFVNSKYSNNGTQVNDGQFPEMLFSLCKQ